MDKDIGEKMPIYKITPLNNLSHISKSVIIWADNENEARSHAETSPRANQPPINEGDWDIFKDKNRSICFEIDKKDYKVIKNNNTIHIEYLGHSYELMKNNCVELL